MAFSQKYFTVIGFFFLSTLAQSFGDLTVLRHYLTDNGSARKLTCMSEDDDAALIWNYNPVGDDLKNEENIFTNFQPKKPKSKKFTECAIWNSSKCHTDWEDMKGWEVVDSAFKPMGPVFDYRWEGFKEFASKQLIQDQEYQYQYVGKVRESSNTAIFSVRGSRDIDILLCEEKEPPNGPCFSIIIGDSNGERSAIRSCDDVAPESGKPRKGKNCVDVANVTHGAKDIVNAYAWRTFRLEWSSEGKKIRVFNETEVKPFLEGTVDQWHPVSHLSIQSELPSRVRFHFYEYLSTNERNAVISTTEFIHNDENFCVDFLVGLCPECKLNVTLIDMKYGDIPLATISGVENSVYDKLQTWRSVRLNATLPNPNSRLLKLKMATVPTGNTVDGLWAIDNLHTCKSPAGFRESTITTNREMLSSENSVWPVVKCQKLSYSENTVVDPPYLGDDVSVSEKINGLLLSRKVRSPESSDPLNATVLELYKADNQNNTISIRLSGLQPNADGIEKYHVSVVKDEKYQISEMIYQVSHELECNLWDNSVCFEQYRLQEGIKLTKAGEGDESSYEIKVAGKSNQNEHSWQCDFATSFWELPPSKPLDLELTEESGKVTMKWRHPLLPYTNIKQFQITIIREKTNLRIPKNKLSTETMNHTILQEQKQYQTTKDLETSSTYGITISAVNNDDRQSEPISGSISVTSGVAFENKDLLVTNNGTSHMLIIPPVTDPTLETWINVIVTGTLTCAQNSSRISSSWIVEKYRVRASVPKNFTINVNNTDDTEPDCVLQPGDTYRIEVEVIDKCSNKSDTLISPTFTFSLINDGTSPIDEGTNLTWIIILTCVLIVIVAILFIFYRRHRKSTANKIEEKIISSTSTSVEIFSSPSDPTENKLPTDQLPPDIVPNYNPHSHSVKVDEFEEYVKEAVESGLLNSQYETFSKGLTKQYDYGSLPENVQKNRYKNLTAYDETRVILNKIPGDPYSDYINANYIKGYGNRKAYIATQGPKPKTVTDFWRMIWQEEVRVICMLANVTEGGKTKCEQYWPEVDCKLKYGDILVSNTGHQVFADYTFRTFKLGCQKLNREVTHLHYTGWPDHGIPMYTQSLVSYLKKLQDTPTGNGPIVVHCSAGVGRTGTIILCDICLQQRLAEDVIDVPTAMIRMREDRASMVDSAQQYLLAHLTIVESVVSVPTQISCTPRLPIQIKELRKQLPFDIQRLNDTVWQDRALHGLALPTTHPGPEGELNPANAVSVDGVKMKKQYLASHLPSPSTLSEFWKVIAEQRIELVIILQAPDPRDTKFCDIMPDESVLVPVPDLQVETKASLVEEEHYTMKRLALTDTSTDDLRCQRVTVLTCTGWACRKDGKPPTAAALVLLWRASEKISRINSPTLVLCRDGVTGCGLYLSLSFLLERMAVERECDVISAVRAVRRSRPEFVQSLKQFDYLYDAAVDYMKFFETYGNFS